ncbi:MAG: GTP-binding protein [Candidatus Lokiarchaeota archaeon]
MIIISKIENKISVHIGLFGHIDSGKTAIAERLSEIISTAGIDAHPQSKERGITIDLGFTSFILDDYLVTLVDGPGHADLIRISASSIEIIDCAIIVIDINKGLKMRVKKLEYSLVPLLMVPISRYMLFLRRKMRDLII